MFGGMVNWIGCVTLLHSIFHMDTRSNLESNTFATCWGNGQLDTRRGGESWSSSNVRLCRGWSESMRACRTSLSMICPLRCVGGAIPESTGRKAIGVGHMHPVIICMVSCKATSNFLVCAPAPHGSSILSRTVSDGECTGEEG